MVRPGVSNEAWMLSASSTLAIDPIARGDASTITPTWARSVVIAVVGRMWAKCETTEYAAQVVNVSEATMNTVASATDAFNVRSRQLGSGRTRRSSATIRSAV